MAGQFERQRFQYGDAAGDKKGDLLRNHVIKAEEAMSILFSWLSGARSEVTLQNALPIERGGTGGTTANSGRLGLGLFVDTNDEIVFGAKAISVYDGLVLDHDGSIKPAITKVDTGHYTITNIPGFALNGFTYRIPKDELGNPLCGCSIEFDTVSSIATLKVYAIIFVDGKYSIDVSQPIDIPNSRCIDISVK